MMILMMISIGLIGVMVSPPWLALRGNHSSSLSLTISTMEAAVVRRVMTIARMSFVSISSPPFRMFSGGSELFRDGFDYSFGGVEQRDDEIKCVHALTFFRLGAVFIFGCRL